MMSLPTRKWLRQLVRLYTLHFPMEKGKGRLVHILRHWLISEEPLVVRVGTGYWMKLDLADYVQRCIYFFGCYEAPLAHYIVSLLRPGMVFVDVGAHVGQYTLLSSQAVGAGGRVFAFEPEPRNFERLITNIHLNGFTNVEAHNCAIADFVGESSFYLEQPLKKDNANWGVYSLHRKAEWMQYQEIQVSVTTLDSVLSSAKRVDVIKVDVEGAELLVFRGAENILKKFHPVLIFEAEERNAQNFGYSTVDVKEYIRSLGYSLYRLPRRKAQKRLIPAEVRGIEDYSTIVALPGGRGHAGV